MEKVSVSVNHIFKMVSLVSNIHARTVKVNEAISNDMASVEEIMDLEDDESIRKTGVGEDREVAEGLLD
jgi:hypothetical protein